MNAGDIDLAAAPEFARGSTTHTHPDWLRVLATTTRRWRRFGGAHLPPWADDVMLTQQHGTCAICLRMVSETPCLDDRPGATATRHLVCDDRVAWHESDDDPDVERLLAAYRHRCRGEDDG